MPLALVTLVSQRDEKFAGWRWYFRIESEQFAVDVDGRGPDGAQRVYLTWATLLISGFKLGLTREFVSRLVH